MKVYYTEMDSSIGKLFLTATDIGMTGIYFSLENIPETVKVKMEEERSHPVLQAAVGQLLDYFSNKRQQFTVPLSFDGTDFQKAVWRKLLEIPYGETRTYAEIAASIQNEKAVRAVGQANRANRLPILIPCHRVIGKNNKLTGYAGKQVDKKELLLKLEGVL
ncbi:methylated-DNA--[protein]-cysteine S-methyltransferase [Siminovitchia acidinfaciens]|uniref:Methylated-DNA--protein-cysteine methyltransferase n=1 Tax=Siminovitchia acidinfaciens TaxID=2321395 RepID=A0A429Y239_9BACI|nr:methylated-DNA--[protein]-cysteine S-methyltransferase [Siminovitchia acidinfaciens]RST75313.1 methylated-DNA--[protein]-cysteine S-methyltransferase [Siminovitchia acidinfaciens]